MLIESNRFFMKENNLNQLALDYIIFFYLILCAIPKDKGSLLEEAKWEALETL
jgi:hypothetical protein